MNPRGIRHARVSYHITWPQNSDRTFSRSDYKTVIEPLAEAKRTLRCASGWKVGAAPDPRQAWWGLRPGSPAGGRMIIPIIMIIVIAIANSDSSSKGNSDARLIAGADVAGRRSPLVPRCPATWPGRIIITIIIIIIIIIKILLGCLASQLAGGDRGRRCGRAPGVGQRLPGRFYRSPHSGKEPEPKPESMRVVTCAPNVETAQKHSSRQAWGGSASKLSLSLSLSVSLSLDFVPLALHP